MKNVLFIVAVIPTLFMSCIEKTKHIETEARIVLDDSIQKPNNKVVEIIDTLDLKIYYPKYSAIDLVCDTMPSKEDTTVIMFAAGAFTAGNDEELSQGKVAGDHVSSGQRIKGYVCERNNGAFVFYNGIPKFFHKNYSHALDEAAKNGGCGFAQEMMIHEGEIVDYKRPDDNINEFRALCQIDGRLAIVDSQKKIRFGDFIDALQNAGVTEALYLDMGGWKYSWYRDDNGNPIEIHASLPSNGTNWLTFYK